MAQIAAGIVLFSSMNPLLFWNCGISGTQGWFSPFVEYEYPILSDKNVECTTKDTWLLMFNLICLTFLHCAFSNAEIKDPKNPSAKNVISTIYHFLNLSILKSLNPFVSLICNVVNWIWMHQQYCKLWVTFCYCLEKEKSWKKGWKENCIICHQSKVFNCLLCFFPKFSSTPLLEVRGNNTRLYPSSSSQHLISESEKLSTTWKRSLVITVRYMKWWNTYGYIM